ncbi:MAG: hypothetical protein IR153_06225 [Flavobacterium sp.]|nr:hypothetical protein [Flavobacterium sp.]
MYKSINVHEFNTSQKLAILIPTIFILNAALKSFIERFRISEDFHWIYGWGSIITLIIGLLTIASSAANSISIILEPKFKLKILWLLLSASVFLYFGIGMTVAMTRNVG